MNSEDRAPFRWTWDMSRFYDGVQTVLWAVVNRWSKRFFFSTSSTYKYPWLSASSSLFNKPLGLDALTVFSLCFSIPHLHPLICVSFFPLFTLSHLFSSLYQQATFPTREQTQRNSRQWVRYTQKDRSLWYFIQHLIKLRARPTPERK